MTLDQLRVFLMVAELEHVTRAAQALNMTQSAVSAAIAALESRHDVRLFDRVGRNIALTDAGRRFVPHARGVVQQAMSAAGVLADLGSGIGGGLRVQASQTVSSYWLPPHLVRYRGLYPQVVLEFAPGNTTTVVAAVLDGSADLGVVEGSVAAPDLLVETVAQDALIVLVGRHHPWADGRRLGLADLAGADWVLREGGSGTRAAFADDLGRLGLDHAKLSVLLDLPTNEACIAAVEAGGVATVLSRRAAAPHLAQGLVAEAGFDLPPRVFSAIRHRNRHLSCAGVALLELLRGAG
ncbi:LysR substrate-binding domain-containing protein [Gemmobacter sp.]|uniref:LysR substrate-binding domain-containing protein n=1 Tax=Gemmobacter sp. TaxID=1898957 RepID=UPI002B00233D|nr:LysR substrate-binding domain-containing protein [Gemmobacter sp.]